jgi:hypothetical protein
VTWFRPRRLAAALWRDHRLITVAAALSLAPRLLAMLAFRPALFTPDSFAYLAEGAHPNLSQWHPSGYPLFLWLLSPLHSLLLVTALQHLIGVATAAGVYALLWHRGLPAWGAALAACPTLIDSRQVALESSILPDTGYALLLTAAVVVVLIRHAPGPARPVPGLRPRDEGTGPQAIGGFQGGPSPGPAPQATGGFRAVGSGGLPPGRPWAGRWGRGQQSVPPGQHCGGQGAACRPGPAQCAAAGVLLFGGAVLRGNGAPEMLAMLAVLAVWRAGLRAMAAAAIAFTLPLLAYMGLFAAKYGNFALTNSDGMFLWSRTMSFADCSVIRPPANLRMLCPDRQPDPPRPAGPWSVPAMLGSPTPAAYLWAQGAWWRKDAHPGFNATNNALALHFALDAIRAQPAGYARTVASGVMLTFLATDRTLNVRQLHFTSAPDVARLDRSQRRHLEAYGHVGSDTHPVEPYAYFLYLYQEPVYFPGIVFGLVLAAGLAGAARQWRHGGGPPALPWAVAALGIVVPVAVHEYHYRYAITVIPVACLAAGLAFARHPAPVPQPAAAPPPAAAGTARVPASLIPQPAPAEAVPGPRVAWTTAGSPESGSMPGPPGPGTAAGSPEPGSMPGPPGPGTAPAEGPGIVPSPRPGGPVRDAGEPGFTERTDSVAGQAPEPEP